MPTDAPTLSDFLCFELYAANHAMSKVYSPHLRALGLTYPQYITLVALWEKDDRTVGALGQTLSLESSTLTPLLKRMEGMGLVTRSRSDQDERVVRISLTEAGRALQDKAPDVPACIQAATGLAPEDLRRLHRDIATLRRNLLSA